MKKLSVNLVIKNGSRYVPFIISSLKRQTYNDFEVLFIDNASDDNTVELLKEAFERENIAYRLIQNSENKGFAVGHNQAFSATNSPYFLLLNVDTYLMPDVLEKAVNFLDQHPDTAAVSPRLMRWDFEKSLAGLNDNADVMQAVLHGFTSQIDAIGIRLFRNRRAVEWLTRQEWTKDSQSNDVQKIFDKKILEVFGVSGAFAAYRKSVVDKILLPGGNLFDPTYHSYKEDLDLAYRLRNAGYVS
jgi:GT2 family glycosyltransferase